MASPILNQAREEHTDYNDAGEVFPTPDSLMDPASLLGGPPYTLVITQQQIKSVTRVYVEATHLPTIKLISGYFGRRMETHSSGADSFYELHFSASFPRGRYMASVPYLLAFIERVCGYSPVSNGGPFLVYKREKLLATRSQPPTLTQNPILASHAEVPTSAPAPVLSPSPSASLAPKTWASLAAANSTKWVTQDTWPVLSSTSLASAVANVGQDLQNPYYTIHQSPAAEAVMNITTGKTFIKGVTEPVSLKSLMDALTSRFGPVRELEIVRSKACAFLEFVQVEAAKKAIIASLPIPHGGEGGIRIPLSDGYGHTRIIIEKLKDRSVLKARRTLSLESSPAI